MERENFPQYYTILFNGIADALKALDQQETSRAWDILVRIQQEWILRFHGRSGKACWNLQNECSI